MNREDNLCWFHGKVSRERAEQILREGKLQRLERGLQITEPNTRCSIKASKT